MEDEVWWTLASNGKYLAAQTTQMDQELLPNKELTMWDVVLDMLLAAQGRTRSISSGDAYAYQISWLSNQLLEHTY
ncbi:hypothetical protein Tco_0290694 [Tanacetum coccineum]